MKRTVIWIMALAMVVTALFAGCASTPAAEETTAVEPAEESATQEEAATNEEAQPEESTGEATAKVFLSIGLGGLGDLGYNDNAYNGAMQAKEELGIDLQVYEPTSVAEIEAQIMAVAASGEYDLILGVGSDNASGIEKAALAYPEQTFAIYEAVFDLPNVLCANNATEQPAFLIGAMVAMLYQENLLPGVPEGTHMMGVINGIAATENKKQIYGLEAGGAYIDPEFELVNMDAGSWTDQAKGKEIALALYERGCGVVMHVAGSTGLGIFDAAKEYGGYCVGSGSNQNDLCDTVICSRIERMDTAIYSTIKGYIEGTLTAGSVRLGYAEGTVTVDFSGSKVTIPQEILDRVEEIKEKIISGEIVVPVTEEEVAAFREANQ